MVGWLTGVGESTTVTCSIGYEMPLRRSRNLGAGSELGRVMRSSSTGSTVMYYLGMQFYLNLSRLLGESENAEPYRRQGGLHTVQFHWNGSQTENLKSVTLDMMLLQRVENTQSMRDDIIGLMVQKGLEGNCYVEMLDYTIDLFESQGLGKDYYGYHNINHELEVTYVTLLSIDQNEIRIDENDIKYMYAAALFHDFDPQKNVDKPHEENVIKFLGVDEKLQTMMRAAEIDFEIIKVLILMTGYPWRGDLKKNAESQIARCFARSNVSPERQEQVMNMGMYLSVVDRISGYALGDFTRSMERAKMNAHASALRPSLIVKNTVAYFEELLATDTKITRAVLECLPNVMRKNFFDTVLSFMKIRQQEIAIQADYTYEHLKLVPTIESMSTRRDPSFIKTLYDIFKEIPTPLQFEKENFSESVMDPQTILNTLRLNSKDGVIVGFAKGGPLERYNIRDDIVDDNRGQGNTIFLEPLVLKTGYWGLRGGSEMRHLFIMQAQSKKYKYLTSFALRDVITARIERENVEFVKYCDPERWDYYRVRV